LREKTTDRYDYKIIKNDNLAFDHHLMIIAGIQRLKNKLQYTDVIFNMMPEQFTLGELQQVYEAILGTKF
jgi:8-oxo-dGTP diphosphatase